MAISANGQNKVRKRHSSIHVFFNNLIVVNTGVLLLNAVLTVRAHNANSHKDKGWELFTDAVIKYINTHCVGVVFMLWGSYAQKKGSAIDKVNLLICVSSNCYCLWSDILALLTF